MSSLKISVLPHFWKDWKKVCKKHKSKEYRTTYSNEEFSSCSDEVKVESIAILNAIKNSIINSIEENCLDGQSPQYDRQPFLSQNWEIRKKRWAIDNSGKSNGMRFIFCLNGNHLLFAYIATKADCADESKLEKEFMGRIKDYLSF
jgi:hypothetical protein